MIFHSVSSVMSNFATLFHYKPLYMQTFNCGSRKLHEAEHDVQTLAQQIKTSHANRP